MPATSTSSHISFFGATGGCVLNSLVKSMMSGQPARALARTPSKLVDLLTQEGISKDARDKLLVIIEGNAKDPEAVKKTLWDEEKGTYCEKIIFGIGGKPTFTPNPLKPSLDDPTVCQSTMSTIISSIASLNFPTPPDLLAISTTGVSDKRDVPVLFLPLYHWLLAIPHQDKQVMEDLVVKAYQEDKVIESYTLVRPSLLTDGKEKSADRVKMGTESTPDIGYTIGRRDVGKWIWEEWALKGTGKYHRVTLSY
ncbi:hypothetical protein T439DRAFT_330166 [Meredithblackwellia eburnea MCA 4105]